MKTLTILFVLFLVIETKAYAQTDFVLEPSQSMLMTGKGPGQDATLNPYKNQDCIAVVKNIGNATFSIRIQKKGKIISEIEISENETKRLTLLKGYELYLDPNPKNISKASVS